MNLPDENLAVRKGLLPYTCVNCMLGISYKKYSVKVAFRKWLVKSYHKRNSLSLLNGGDWL
jgi:hypothetical protein